MTVQEAYKAFLAADEAWSKDLQRVFGKKAGDVRYTDLGHTHPECVSSYARFEQAGQVWRAKMVLAGRAT